MKKELCRTLQFTSESHATAKSFCVMWLPEELYRSTGTVHMFLSQEFRAVMVSCLWNTKDSGKNSQKKFRLHATLMINQEIKNQE